MWGCKGGCREGWLFFQSLASREFITETGAGEVMLAGVRGGLVNDGEMFISLVSLKCVKLLSPVFSYTYC